MGGFDVRILTRNKVSYNGCDKSSSRAFLVFFHCRVFAAFAFRQDRMVVTTGDNGFQVDPTAMHRAGGTTVCFRLFPQVSHLTLQICCKARTLLGIFGEKRFQLRISYSFRSLLEAFLPVFKRLN